MTVKEGVGGRGEGAILRRQVHLKCFGRCLMSVLSLIVDWLEDSKLSIFTLSANINEDVILTF